MGSSSALEHVPAAPVLGPLRRAQPHLGQPQPPVLADLEPALAVDVVRHVVAAGHRERQRAAGQIDARGGVGDLPLHGGTIIAELLDPDLDRLAFLVDLHQGLLPALLDGVHELVEGVELEPHTDPLLLQLLVQDLAVVVPDRLQDQVRERQRGSRRVLRPE